MVIYKGVPIPFIEKLNTDFLVYHQACHVEWSGVPKLKAADVYREKLEKLFGVKLKLSPGCCGESGLGALTSPSIYYTIKKRKKKNNLSKIYMNTKMTFQYWLGVLRVR